MSVWGYEVRVECVRDCIFTRVICPTLRSPENQPQISSATAPPQLPIQHLNVTFSQPTPAFLPKEYNPLRERLNIAFGGGLHIALAGLTQ